jgi:hypothetical protein
MVVKPLESIVQGRRGLVQPGVKVRDVNTYGSSTGPNTRRRRTLSG